MTANDLISQLSFNQFALRRLLADVSHEDSLYEPQAGVNSINFLLGHILNTRDRMLILLDGSALWDEDTAALYKGKPKTYSAATALPFAALQTTLEESFAAIQTVLLAAESRFGDAASKKFIRDGETIGDQMGFFVCHEEYHVGQIGLLRRLMNKPGLF